MNLSQSRVVLRERGVGEILDLAGLIVGAHALRLYLWLTVAVLLPCYAGCLALHYVLEVPTWFVWLAAVGLASFSGGVFTLAAGQWLFSEKLGVREVLGAFFSRFGSYMFTWLARQFVVVGSGILLFLPLYFGPMLLFSSEACLLEHSGPSEATARSASFTRYRRGRAFGMWCCLLGLRLLIVLLVFVLCDALVDDVLQLGRPFGKWYEEGFSPYALLGLMISVPYVATTRFLMYIDGRTRADGWDIQVRFMAISQETTTTPGLGGVTLRRTQAEAAP